MILIHSRQTDNTTIEIIQWLKYLQKDFLRLNSIRDFKKIQALLHNNVIESIYCNGLGMLMNRMNIQNDALRSQIQQHLEEDEELIWSNLLRNKISGLKQFGAFPYPKNCLNKLDVLDSALEVGLKIPDYELVTTKKRLLFLKETWGRIICKSVGDGISINTNEVDISEQRTEEVKLGDIENFPDEFFPTLIQKLIEKEYEIRVFYFNGTLHSIAIFSQQNAISSIDGRSFDRTRPQRQVPYSLPPSLQEKIKKLMEYLQLNYGSLDLIVDPNSDFIFLEVNPYGQYGFVSKAGNYYIEKEIANYL